MRTSASIRAGIGTTRVRIARWARVSVPTIVLYEAKPEAVRDDQKRGACARVYAILARALEQLEQEVDRGQQAVTAIPAPAADRGRRAQRRPG